MYFYCNLDYAEMFSIFLHVSGSYQLRTSVQKLLQIMVFLMNSWLRTLGQKLVSDWLYIRNWLMSSQMFNVGKYVKWEVLQDIAMFGLNSVQVLFLAYSLWLLPSVFVANFKFAFVTDVNISNYFLCILIFHSWALIGWFQKLWVWLFVSIFGSNSQLIPSANWFKSGKECVFCCYIKVAAIYCTLLSIAVWVWWVSPTACSTEWCYGNGLTY